MIQESIKQCVKCQVIKSINEFCKDNSKKDNLCIYCKGCRNTMSRQYNKTHKEHVSTHNKERYLKNKTQNQQRHKKNYLLNKEKILQRHKTWRQNNPDYHNNYIKNRCKIDSNYRLINTLRNRMRDALKSNRKSSHSIDLLMCTIDEWKKHLESQFTEDMSWNNYGNKAGQWSIDHIIPCSFFDLTDPVEQYMCFRWQNTRPMWHVENMQKHNKLY